MRRNIVIVAGLVLLVSAMIAMPVSAGNGQSGSSANCVNGQFMDQNCVAYTGDVAQGPGYCYQNSEGYCYQNSECTGDCPNDGVRPLDGTGLKHGRGGGVRGTNAGNCPFI